LGRLDHRPQSGVHAGARTALAANGVYRSTSRIISSVPRRTAVASPVRRRLQMLPHPG
jgi:hypothetical protein